jgi:tRNA pseudouridine38-40 synthase
MPTFKLTLAYDGTNYAGWQVQSNRHSVQAELEAALQYVTGESLRAMASSRTDTGVHALGQVVSFVSETKLAPEVLQRALNARLPADVVVVEAKIVSDDFYALRHTIKKRYRYQLHDGPLRPILDRQYLWHVFQKLDAEKMHRAAQVLVGQHNFASFTTGGSEPNSTVRTVREVIIERGRGGDPNLVTLEIEADGFLYHMVRNITGTLYDVGRGFQAESYVGEVLAAKHRGAASQAAPPQGLTLLHITCRE